MNKIGYISINYHLKYSMQELNWLVFSDESVDEKLIAKSEERTTMIR